MELRQLVYFVRIAQQAHFTRAAAELHIAQPSLSQQMQHLEQELGVALFARVGRGVRLTPAGEAFLIRATHILTEVSLAEREMQEYAGLIRGKVTLGTLQSLGSFWLPALLARFHSLFPGIDLVLREAMTDQLLTLLVSGDLDVSLLHTTENAPLPALQDAALDMEPLLREDLVVVVAPQHPLAGSASLSLQAMLAEPVIAFKSGSGLRRALDEACVAAGLSLHVSFESGDVNTIRALAAEGLGVALLPRSIAEAPGRPVAIGALDVPGMVRTVMLVWRRAAPLSPGANAFLDFVRADIRQNPWPAGAPEWSA